MTQLFRRRRHLPGRLAGTVALLGAGVLAGCADQITSAGPTGVGGPPLNATSGYTQQYEVPYHPNSATDGAEDFPWTQSSITVPRAGRYRLRVQGSITATMNPIFPNVCSGNGGMPSSDPIGTYGPMGKRVGDVGDVMQVRVYTGQLPYSRFNQGFSFTTVDAQTMETVVTLPAGASLWTMFSGYTAWTWCGQYYPHYLFTGTHTLTVTELAGATLECKGANGGTTVERGQMVRCALRSENPFRVLSRRATGEGVNVSETPGTSHAAGSEHVWEGPAVATTQVRMVAEITENGTTQQNTYTASFTVQPRDWPKLQLNPPTVTIGLRGNMTPYPPNGRLGNAGPKLTTAALATLPLGRVNIGPNTGLIFLLGPFPAVDHEIYLHPGLYDRPADAHQPWQRWHRDQNGVGSGTCTQAMFSVLEPFARRHEGGTQADDSHWGITRRFYETSDSEQRLERIYSQTESPGEVYQTTFDTWLALHTSGTHKTQQEAFDAAEGPAMTAAINCTPDDKLGDP